MSIRPTIKTIYNAVRQPKLQSLEAVMKCMTPESALDRLRSSKDEKKFYPLIWDRVLSFPPPGDNKTYAQLGKVFIDSGLMTVHTQDTDGALRSLAERALETDQNQWVQDMMENAFHVMARTQIYKPQTVYEWIQRNAHDAELMQNVARFAIKILRYERLAQNDYQAHGFLGLLDVMAKEYSHTLDQVDRHDITKVEALMRKAKTQDDPLILRFVRKKILEHIATPKAPAPRPKI